MCFHTLDINAHCTPPKETGKRTSIDTMRFNYRVFQKSKPRFFNGSHWKTVQDNFFPWTRKERCLC